MSSNDELSASTSSSSDDESLESMGEAEGSFNSIVQPYQDELIADVQEGDEIGEEVAGEQTHFSAFVSPAEKIASAISSCETISVTSVFLHQSEFGSCFCGANARGLYVRISICAR